MIYTSITLEGVRQKSLFVRFDPSRTSGLNERYPCPEALEGRMFIKIKHKFQEAYSFVLGKPN